MVLDQLLKTALQKIQKLKKLFQHRGTKNFAGSKQFHSKICKIEDKNVSEKSAHKDPEVQRSPSKLIDEEQGMTDGQSGTLFNFLH